LYVPDPVIHLIDRVCQFGALLTVVPKQLAVRRLDFYE
jgi:hypothetical protein